eukprot:CAMPEP_0195303144 /NCGR_PEP_ID=MMETSP0707-20130614/32307_1 /TAXON_ID=33640 /ORGANISM="Asterionellopsis glacialis, Strain CCMP134" /LENGTH=488 /DNA_ID=CAMNT_0040366607 /DNA_START=89 /DNA_END=1555 /DNA_ORIENTATION=-
MAPKSTTTEDEKESDSSKPFSEMQSFKLLLLMLMVVQNSSFALVGRYTRSSVAAAEDLYIVSHVILCQECVKFVVSSFLEHKTSPQSLLASIKHHVFANPMDALKISIPALLYLIQTSLLFVALSNLPAPLYQVAFQGKLLTTAFVSVLMLQRKYTLKQWTCLVSLGVGVAIVVLGERHVSSSFSSSQDSTETPTATTRSLGTTTMTSQGSLNTNDSHQNSSMVSNNIHDVMHDGQQMAQNMLLGLLCVTGACFCSAFASVYTEKLLKKPATVLGDSSSQPTASLWMRNIQMAFFSICIATFQILSEEQRHNNTAVGEEQSQSKSFFHGFTPWVYALVLIQAVGGLLVAAVMKYTDNVLKGLAMSVSVVLSTASSIVLFDTPLTLEFVVGATVVLGSVYLFSNEVPQNRWTAQMGLWWTTATNNTIPFKPSSPMNTTTKDQEIQKSLMSANSSIHKRRTNKFMMGMDVVTPPTSNNSSNNNCNNENNV